MPSRWSRPWTTSRATSSSRDTSCSAALRAATAGQITTSPSSVSAPSSGEVPGPLPAEVGRAARRPRLVLDGEGQHVGRAGLAQELLVQRGDGLLVDEEQRDLGLPLDATCRQHLAGQPRPAGDVDRMVLLLVGGEDVDGHWVEPARPSATS